MTTKLTRICASLLLAGATFTAQAADPIQVKIVSFNDFHGNLFSPGNFSGKSAGGADYPGPVNTTDVSANERPGVQGKADDAARTGCPGQEDNAAMRAGTFVPSGLPA